MGWPKAGYRRCILLTKLPTPLPNRFSWRYQLREFQSHFHVVAVDMRGYSPSDAPKEVDCYTIDLLLDDIKDTILGLGMTHLLIFAPFGTYSYTSTSSLLYLIPLCLSLPTTRVLQVHPREPRLGGLPCLGVLHLLPIPSGAYGCGQWSSHVSDPRCVGLCLKPVYSPVTWHGDPDKC